MKLHRLAVLAVASIAISGLEIGPTRAADDPTTKANANNLRQAAMNNGGNPDRGKKVFLSASAQCAPCHKFHGQGGDVGPDLSQIGGKFDRPISLNPSSTHPRKFFRAIKPRPSN